jgi:hypothetical protein
MKTSQKKSGNCHEGSEVVEHFFNFFQSKFPENNPRSEIRKLAWKYSGQTLKPSIPYSSRPGIVGVLYDKSVTGNLTRNLEMPRIPDRIPSRN